MLRNGKLWSERKVLSRSPANLSLLPTSTCCKYTTSLQTVWNGERDAETRSGIPRSCSTRGSRRLHLQGCEHQKTHLDNARHKRHRRTSLPITSSPISLAFRLIVISYSLVATCFLDSLFHAFICKDSKHKLPQLAIKNLHTNATHIYCDPHMHTIGF